MNFIKCIIIVLLFFPGFKGIKGQSTPESGDRPLNVILMIGDGMGLSQLSVPYFYMEDEPVFSSFEHIGLQKTSSGSHPVTQSSAAATAMSTGIKTYNRAVGVDLDSIPVENLVEILSGRGYMTGVVATSSITDATPAGFYAHVKNRYMHHEIAMQLIHSEIDFFAGGGIKHFIDPNGIDHFKKNGIVVNFAGLEKISEPDPGSRFGFLLASERMPAMLEGRRHFLRDASSIAMDFLSSGGQGFFLMIEGSQIDWAGHGNNVKYMITEMNDFEEAVRNVLDFARQDGRTLVIVTADHETGGFTLGAAGENGTTADYSTIKPTFATTNHSAALVPVLAYGPGAENFAGVYENTDIFHKLVSLAGQGDR